MNRRNVLAAAGAAVLSATAVAPNAHASGERRVFPRGFLWGAATAGHQIEGNNVSSDAWLAEHVQPTLFAEPSNDACNGFERWASDLDLVHQLGLNSHRFSLEWSRIEPENGQFSIAMLDHYKALITGCHARAITPVVTFNHFTVPRWFAALGGWTSADSPQLFARFCDRAARHLGDGIGYALTLNEPNGINIIVSVFPAPLIERARAMNEAAGRACGSSKFRCALLATPDEAELVSSNLMQAHRFGREAIKAARRDLPVGFSLALQDDEAVGPGSVRDAKRRSYYGAWLELGRSDDFIGVQNYVRSRWGAAGQLPPPPGARLNMDGSEVYPPSLANAVRYAHQASGVPIMVTEHGVASDDDTLRAGLISGALTELHRAIGEGVPVLGYHHWSLMDNFEWVFGYNHKFGLCSVDRASFARTPKPSAWVLRDIARRNSV